MIFTGMPRRLRISSLQKRVQEREAENSRNEDKVIKDPAWGWGRFIYVTYGA
jgi:hypothetical protein